MNVRDAIRNFWEVLRSTFHSFKDREPLKNSIVIAYYAIFSLPGLLIIIINLAGYFFGYEAVTNQITSQVQGTIGKDTATSVQHIIANASLDDNLL